MEQSRRLTKLEIVGYSVGDLGQNLIFQTISIYLLIFYTDTFGIPAAAASTLFLVARVWDAINDPIMGGIVDKTNTKWGKFRPYLLFGAIPFAVLSVLCFTTPNFSATGKLIYAYVTYIGLGMIYTIVNVPFGALTSSITQDAADRGIISVFRVIFGTIAGITVVIAVPLLSETLGGGDMAKGYQYAMTILAILGAITILVAFASTKERHTVKNSGPKITLKSTITLLKSNRPLQIICLAFLVIFGNMAIAGSVGAFFFKYNLNRPDLFPVNTALSMIVMLVTLFFTPLLLKRGIDKKNILIFGMAISLVRALANYTMSIPIIMIATVIGAIGSGFASGVIWGLVPDTIEYGEYKTGIRAEGMVYAVVGFFYKLGMALGGLVPGYVLDWTGYVPDAVQTSTASMGILTLVSTIPIVLMVVFLLVMRSYPLDSKTYNDIVAKLKDRNKSDDEILTEHIQ